MSKGEGKQSLFETFRMVFWLIGLWTKMDFLGFFGLFISAIVDPLFFLSRWYVLAYFVDQMSLYSQLGGDITGYILRPALLFFIFYLAQRISFSAGRYFSTRINTRLRWKFNVKYGKKVEEFSLFDIDNREFANKITLANEAKDNILFKMGNIISIFSSIIAAILMGLPLALDGNGYIALFIIVISLPSVLVNTSFQKKQISFRLSRVEPRRRSREALNVFMGISEESKEMKINNAYQILAPVGFGENKYYQEGILSHQKRWFWGRSFTSILESLLLSFVIVLYIWNIVNEGGTITGVIPLYGTLNLMRIYTYNFMNSFVQISEYYEEIVRIKDFLEYKAARLFSLNKNNKDIASAPKVNIKNMSFTYPKSDAAVFSDIDLDIDPGDKVAFVGVNGAGKTTLVKLILGMYPASGGQINVNGKDIFSYTRDQWYGVSGILFQEFPKYGFLSVRENIMIGNPNKASDDEIWNVLGKASAKSFVEKYPNKLDQILDHKYKGGISPSTGQWQKLAIARMFYRNPQLVIFDEPTASIDAEAEYNIFNEIFKFFKNKTVIIVSHRFSTVKNADKIVVIDRGKIVEQGTHDELMELDGQYAHSYRKQSEAYK